MTILEMYPDQDRDLVLMSKLLTKHRCKRNFKMVKVVQVVKVVKDPADLFRVVVSALEMMDPFSVKAC